MASSSTREGVRSVLAAVVAGTNIAGAWLNEWGRMESEAVAASRGCEGSSTSTRTSGSRSTSARTSQDPFYEGRAASRSSTAGSEASGGTLGKICLAGTMSL